MRAVLVALLAVSVLGSAEVPAAKPVILVTGFAPFAGRAVNGSGTLATALEGSEIAGAVVRTLVMPVRWGEPTRVIPQQVEALHPIAILGLGEGYPAKVTVEAVGANLAIRAKDTDGKLPQAPRLDAAGPAERPARFRLDPAWFPMAAVPVLVSRDAGGYLCNEALYAITATTVPVAGFVHVPPQGDEADAAYRARLLPLIRELITRNLPGR